MDKASFLPTLKAFEILDADSQTLETPAKKGGAKSNVISKWLANQMQIEVITI